MPNPLRIASNRIANQTQPSKIFNDRIIENDDEFKLFAALYSGDAIIEFYDLQEKKFAKEISIKKPFLVSVKMNCWDYNEPAYMHRVYSYNKKLSTMLNEHIKTSEIKLDVSYDRWPGGDKYERDCLQARKAMKREVTKTLCQTKEQAILMTKFLYMNVSKSRSYNPKNVRIAARFSKGGSKIDWKGEVLPRYAELERKLIELGVNVKFMTYYHLIKSHLLSTDGSDILTGDSVKKHIFKHSFSLVEHLPRDTKNVFEKTDRSVYEQCAFLHKNGYYFSVIDNRFKNTKAKVLNLLKVNSQVSAKLIDMKIRKNIEFNVECLKNGYRKVIATNEETYSPEFILALTIALEKEMVLDCLTGIPRKIRQNAMLSDSVAQGMFSIVDSKIDMILASPETAQKSESVRRQFSHCMSYIAQLLPKSFYTKSFLEKLLALIDKTAGLKYETRKTWELDEPILRSVSDDMQEAIFNPSIWTRFKASDRKPYEYDAIDFSPANINYCVKSIRESDLVNAVAWADFTAIRFNKVCGKKPDYRKIANCLDLAIRSLEQKNLNNTSALFTRPDPYILNLLSQLGSDEVSASDICYGGYSKELLKNLLKACNAKIFEERYPTKGTTTKRLKI